GGAGLDHLEGNDGDDSLFGNNGNDTILGGNGADTIDGGGDSDSIDGGAGDDSMEGDSGAGDDSFVAGSGNDTIDGNGGSDKVFFTGQRAEYTVAETAGGVITVIDHGNLTVLSSGANHVVVDRDGMDQLHNIENLDFLVPNPPTFTPPLVYGDFPT